MENISYTVLSQLNLTRMKEMFFEWLNIPTRNIYLKFVRTMQSRVSLWIISKVRRPPPDSFIFPTLDGSSTWGQDLFVILAHIFVVGKRCIRAYWQPKCDSEIWHSIHIVPSIDSSPYSYDAVSFIYENNVHSYQYSFHISHHSQKKNAVWNQSIKLSIYFTNQSQASTWPPFLQ